MATGIEKSRKERESEIERLESEIERRDSKRAKEIRETSKRELASEYMAASERLLGSGFVYRAQVYATLAVAATNMEMAGCSYDLGTIAQKVKDIAEWGIPGMQS